jgi:queuine/archaeosine tRNA-ribosyltransferase
VLAVIQGNDCASIRFCAEELARLGFPRYGLGSLARLYHTAEIVRRVETAMRVVGPGLHVFGVAALATMRVLAQMGVTSVDTARPMHAAFCNEILYSWPYRRVGIIGTRYAGSSRPKFVEAQQIAAPLPCDCPPCQEDPWRLLGMRGQRAIHHRALHNAYHLAREVTRLEGHRTAAQSRHRAVDNLH